MIFNTIIFSFVDIKMNKFSSYKYTRVCLQNIVYGGPLLKCAFLCVILVPSPKMTCMENGLITTKDI